VKEVHEGNSTAGFEVLEAYGHKDLDAPGRKCPSATASEHEGDMPIQWSVQK